MINKKIEEIREADLQDLIDNKVLESKTIEYKRDLPDNSDSAKKEFLADITSFANSSGGDLIFGISQDNQTGEPKAIEGIEIENPDKEKTRLDNIIRSGVEPRLLSVAIQTIPLSNSKYAILIRVPKSWIGPHRVIYVGHAKFYARNSSGKYEMDVSELRIAFNLTETIAERIRKFRVDRISNIFADETPMPLYQNPKIVLHLIPINSFNPSQKYDIDCITSHPEKLIPINSMGWDWRFNIDGFLTYSGGSDGRFYSYVQLNRNGIIEAVEGSLIRPRKTEDEKIRFFIPDDFEKKLFEAFNSYLKILPELRVDPPIFVFLSLLGVKGYIMAIYDPIGFHPQHPIDRDLLLLLVWKECYRVLHKGCRLCINIGDQFARSVYYGRYKVIPIREEIIKFCETIGFDYMGAIIWQKVTTCNTTGGATIMGSFPYPRNGIIKLDYEFILIFKKLGEPPKVSREVKERSKLTTKEWNEYFYGHWNFSGERQNKHLAMFPEELPKRLIKMFSFSGDTVLDPFLGSGTTCLSANKLGRHSVGYEINKDFLPVIKEKLSIENGLEDFKIIFQKDKTIDCKKEIGNLPYIFKDPVRFDKKIDPKQLKFGSKIDNSEHQREQYYSVKEIISPEIVTLNNDLKVRLIGVKEKKEINGKAIQFLKEKLKGQRYFLDLIL